MAGDGHGVFVAVSANQVCCDHIERLCRQEGYPAPRIVSDPSELEKLLEPPPGAEPAHQGRSVAGIILDLTTPQPRSQNPARRAPDAWEVTNTKEAAEVVACLIAVALAAHDASTPPLLVISANDYLGQAFQRGGMPLTAQLAPDADDATWHHALARLSMHDRGADSAQNGYLTRRATDPTRSPAAIRLHRDLWLDLDGCALYRGDRDRVISLTGREVELITVLFAAPRRYLRTPELARRLARSGIVELDEHCVEQTVSGLRRKLGETARNARVLRTRHGVGYGLFSEDA